jgi:hypothetical protein
VVNVSRRQNSDIGQILLNLSINPSCKSRFADL